MTARLIDAATRLKVIARHGVGVDSVDLGSGLINQSQNAMAAAMQIAEK